MWQGAQSIFFIYFGASHFLSKFGVFEFICCKIYCMCDVPNLSPHAAHIILNCHVYNHFCCKFAVKIYSFCLQMAYLSHSLCHRKELEKGSQYVARSSHGFHHEYYCFR